MVLCGAEAVLESGGVVNRTGTYQVAIVAAEIGSTSDADSGSSVYLRRGGEERRKRSRARIAPE